MKKSKGRSRIKNNNITKHKLLQILMQANLFAGRENGGFVDLLTFRDIVRNLAIDEDDVIILLNSLKAYDEVVELIPEDKNSQFDPIVYNLTNKGIAAFEDEKYLRIHKERKNIILAKWLSIASLIISAALAVYTMFFEDKDTMSKITSFLYQAFD